MSRTLRLSRELCAVSTAGASRSGSAGLRKGRACEGHVVADESVVEEEEEEEKPLFPAIERTSIGLQAVKAIRSGTVAGQLRRGNALPPERELAKSLGGGRPSVREAIQDLHMVNIIESRQGEATCVSSLDPVLLCQHIWVLLQVSAARLAATRITKGELGTMEALGPERGEAHRPA